MGSGPNFCEAKIWGCSSAGRAPALQAGGQEFDPPQLHQNFTTSNILVALKRALNAATSGVASVVPRIVLSNFKAYIPVEQYDETVGIGS